MRVPFATDRCCGVQRDELVSNPVEVRKLLATKVIRCMYVVLSKLPPIVQVLLRDSRDLHSEVKRI